MGNAALRNAGVLLAALLVPLLATAQTGLTVGQEYDKLIASRSSVTTLGADLFGDEVDLYTGALSFRQVDVSLPGNNGLEVAVGRRFTPRQWFNRQGMFGDWDLDIPHLEGTFATAGWITLGTPSNARCSQYGPPPSATGTQGNVFSADEFWAGNFLVLPGRKGGGEILKARAGTPVPSDGQTYPLTTRDGVVFRCLPSVTGSGTGEGFEAVTPDGTRYRFDYISYRTARRVERDTGYLNRREVWILPTLVTDRFGNTVTYTWGTSSLTIAASDGRWLTLTYANGRVASVTDGTRTWSYSYTTVSGSVVRLSTVTLPDASQWSFSLEGLRGALHEPVSGSCVEGGTFYPSSGSGTLVHPSGATGTFAVAGTVHGRSYVPPDCRGYAESGYAYYPAYFTMASITSKAISGPGLANQTWTYSYGPDNACWSTAGQPGMYPCNAGSPTTKYVQVTAPDASVTRYTFGNKFRDTEAQLLQVDAGVSGSTALRTTVNTYAPPSTGPWPDPYGLSIQPRNDGYMASRHAPLQTRVITQQGQNFNWQVSATCGSGSSWCYDPHARPTKILRGATRTETLAYHDNTTKWVLGQLAQTAVNGIVTASATYDSTYATQLTFSAFTRLKQTLTWDTWSPASSGQLGTIQTVRDGNNNLTTLSSWKRGIPQGILHADNYTESAVVNDQGWITSVTDENGFTTGYGYDAMGRLSSIVYPAGDSTVWNNTTLVFQPFGSAEYGIAAGHWRQTVTTGNAVKVTYFDALWRPVLTREYDANVAGTLRFQRFSYDHEGHTTFASYPGATDALTAGITTQYDALGRVAWVSQHSELGALNTYSSYLSGFQTQVTDPRGYQTTTSYLAFDEPTTEWPVLIAHPQGAYTHISRDVFGKPTQLRRSDSGSPVGGSVALSRYYVYRPDYQTLCKTIEPETGATVRDYDGAGNLGWIASGLNLPSTADCNLNEGYYSGRTVYRGFDARNRLGSLGFQDGRGNQTWVYTPDGLPSSITTNNANGGEQVINSYTYNKRRLLTSESLTQPGWYTWTMNYGFDGNAHLSQQSYPSGLVVYRSLNALGQTTQVYDQFGTTYASGVSYHPNGAVAGFTYGNGIVHTMTQNARQLPQRSTDGSVADLGYAYDPNGNVGQIADYVNGQQTRGMSYDGLNRLTQTTSSMFGTASYGYDVLDNLTHVAVGASNNRPARDHYYCYDGAWRLTEIRSGGCGGAMQWTLSWDVQGNLYAKGAQTYEFDYGNRLRAVPGLEYYRYDGYGRRVLNNHPTENFLYQYGQSGELAFIWYEGRHNEMVYLAGSLVAIRDTPVGGSPAVKYQHNDALGSPIATTNASQGLIDTTEYEPYGAQGNRPLANGPGYTGHVQDAATGLTYMQQRYYDPVVGRFLSADPVTALEAPVAAFNRYRYANNNPYKFVDPDGRLAWFIPMIYAAYRAYSAYDTVSSAIENVQTLADKNASDKERLLAGADLAASLVGGKLGRAGVQETVRAVDNAKDAARATVRGGESAAAAAGRQAHKDLAERLSHKPGWQSEPRLQGADGKFYRPDAVTPNGRILELKPNTPSGRAAGERQIRNYEEQLGMPGRVIYYGPYVP